MLVDTDALPLVSTTDADVCVVGAGPAGITVATQLALAGIRVCVLESGGLVPDRRSRRLARGRNVGHPYLALAASRARGLGGSSHLWRLDEGWRARPLDRQDLDVRPWLPHSGWPLARTDLDPFYGRAQVLCGLGPPDYTTGRWLRDRPPLPLPRVITTEVFQYSHRDFTGCLGQLAAMDSLRLYLDATAIELVTRPDRTAVRRIVASLPGRRQLSIRSRHVVLAAGGIDNARLLLLSQEGRRPGLGNDHDLVGRFFMERVALATGAIVPAEHELVDQLGAYRPHTVDGTTVQGVLQVAAETRWDARLLNCAVFLDRPRPGAALGDGARALKTLRAGVIRRRPLRGWAVDHARAVIRDTAGAAAAVRSRVSGSRSADAVVGLVVQGEPSPLPDSRITLGRRRDPLGLPEPVVEWRIADRDRRSVRATQRLIDAALRDTRIGAVTRLLGDERPPALIDGSHHHLGTTRMDPDPSGGVVDADCRVHGLDNLYVAGSSVFPTAGCANPTLTLVALALRLADHLLQRLD